MSLSPAVRTVLVGVDDLFFMAKIQSTANCLGIRLLEAASFEQLTAQLEVSRPALIILDLNSSACRPLEFIERLKKESRHAGIPMVGFLSHVQVGLEQAARRAGCETVLPRSKFSANLVEILNDR